MAGGLLKSGHRVRAFERSEFEDLVPFFKCSFFPEILLGKIMGKQNVAA
jgi:hypothetical protein